MRAAGLNSSEWGGCLWQRTSLSLASLGERRHEGHLLSDQAWDLAPPLSSTLNARGTLALWSVTSAPFSHANFAHKTLPSRSWL